MYMPMVAVVLLPAIAAWHARLQCRAHAERPSTGSQPRPTPRTRAQWHAVATLVLAVQTPVFGELLSSFGEAHAWSCLHCGTQAKFKLSMQQSVAIPGGFCPLLVCRSGLFQHQ
jgi:hypothetical protein